MKIETRALEILLYFSDKDINSHTHSHTNESLSRCLSKYLHEFTAGLHFTIPKTFRLGHKPMLVFRELENELKKLQRKFLENNND